MTFATLGLIEPLLRALETLGYKTPTPVQAQAIPAVLAGRDLMAAAQTGTGKTGGFALPLLQSLTMEGPKVASNSVRALVLVPTRELAEQVHESIRQYAEHLPLSTYAVYGGVSINPQMMKMRKGVDVLVATPGRLLDLYRQKAIKFNQLQTLILDEADRMLDLGFSEELRDIYRALPKKRQTLLFSATFSDAIRLLAEQMLYNPLSIEVSPRNVAASSVKQWVIPVDKKRKAELFLHLLRTQHWKQVLVFAKTRNGVDELVGKLQALGSMLTAFMATSHRPRANGRWTASRPAKCRSWWLPMWLPVAWTSKTCRWWSTSTCQSWPKTIFTVLVAPVVPVRRAKPFRWSVLMK
jgi:Superfamily II DNA and RNA helicases